MPVWRGFCIALMHVKFDMAFLYFHGNVFVEVELVVQHSS